MTTTLLPSRVSRRLRSLMRRSPFDDLRAEMDDLINQFSAGWNGDFLSGFELPSADIAETDTAVEVKLDVPGFKPEDIQVEVRNNVLYISGQHKEETEEKNKRYHRVERRSGSIQRTIALPAMIDEDKVTAQCRDGVLTVTLPKTEQSQSKKITVKS